MIVMINLLKSQLLYLEVYYIYKQTNKRGEDVLISRYSVAVPIFTPVQSLLRLYIIREYNTDIILLSGKYTEQVTDKHITLI